jgi:D-lyxose ketol-isomerase
MQLSPAQQTSFPPTHTHHFKVDKPLIENILAQHFALVQQCKKRDRIYSDCFFYYNNIVEKVFILHNEYLRYLSMNNQSNVIVLSPGTTYIRPKGTL